MDIDDNKREKESKIHVSLGTTAETQTVTLYCSESPVTPSHGQIQNANIYQEMQLT